MKIVEIVVAAVMLSGATARANLVLTNPILIQTGFPGGTANYTGTLLNTSSNPVLIIDAFLGSTSGIAPVGHTPNATLAAGEIRSVIFWQVLIPSNAPTGVSASYNSLSVAGVDQGNLVFASPVNLRLDTLAPSPVPEPTSFGLITLSSLVIMTMRMLARDTRAVSQPSSSSTRT